MEKVLVILGKAVAVLIPYGLVYFFVMFMGLMGMFPLYVTEAAGVVGAVLYFVIVARLSGYLSPKAKRIMGWAVAAMTVLALIYVGAGLYKDNLDIVEGQMRDSMLGSYEPFRENSRAVKLEKPAGLQLTAQEARRLRLDGATALYPVYAGFVQAVYPEKEYPVYDPVYASAYPEADDENGYGQITCSGTTEAYERLLAGKTDMIFVAGPSDAQLQRAEELGMELHMTPVGKEAFVFFVNSKNPVENLTVEQIRGIYSGEITNWKEVGGRNRSIRAFQRAEDSGSQTALQRLMGDIPLMEPEEEDRITAMDGIVRDVADYRNYRNALGFSFRFYCTEMMKEGNIKLLALDGVEPTKETIQDGSYPSANCFYAVTASKKGEPAPENSREEMKKFIRWILSEEGQRVVEETGYVAVTAGA